MPDKHKAKKLLPLCFFNVKMPLSKAQFYSFILQLASLLGLYACCRLVFITVNFAELDLGSTQNLFMLFVGALRFDLSAIAATNALYFLLLLMPFAWHNRLGYKKAAFILFMLFNGIALMANLIDVAYFPFVHKRSQADTLLFLTGEKGGDFFRLLPTFIVDYGWYLIPIYACMLYLLYRLFQKTWPHTEAKGSWLLQLAKGMPILALTIGLIILAIRGGLQTRPLDIVHASEVTGMRNVPALLNSPFTIMKSSDRAYLQEKTYLPETTINNYYQGIHYPTQTDPFTKRNVVVIIVESLSKRHVGLFGGKAQTPFLDSLFKQSMLFTNGYANAKESIQGIPAILSSIPSWQDESYIFSLYAANKSNSLASLLKEQGYATSFFHGGFNGTMGFDGYTAMAGFNQYYGRNEYNNEQDYDGHWGIWDQPFLQFMAKELDKQPQPFLSAVFTLNTHHPFKVPTQLAHKFNKHKEPFLNCVEYADYALQNFFETIKKSSWYNNTLFVITADHTAPALSGERINSAEDYQIPIAFFAPYKNLKAEIDAVISQIDIMPMVLDELHYPKPFFAFGTHILNNPKRQFTVNYQGNVYQYIDKQWCYQFNGEKGIALYHITKDKLFQNNVLFTADPNQVLHCDSNLKACIQYFNRCMIQNKMTVE